MSTVSLAITLKTMRRGARERHEEEGELVVPEVRVDPRFRRYWKGMDKPNVVPSLFGTQYDQEWDFDDWTRDWVSADKRHMRIIGAPNWTDVWPKWKDVGKDQTLLGTEDEPLDPIQMKMMEKYCDIKVKFEKRLGGGNNGTVYKVKCQTRVVKLVDSDQPSSSQGASTSKRILYIWGPAWDAACKIMRFPNRGKKPKIQYRVDRLLQDFLTLRYLKQENIVQMLNMVAIPDSDTRFPYSTVLLLMEVCDGDLLAIQNNCPYGLIPHVIVKKMMRDICTGLQYMHNQNMAHLDVKPDNILFKWNAYGSQLTETNLLLYIDTLIFKLGDLGFCMTFNPDEPAVTNKGWGTLFYMSYEMKELRAKIRTDEVEVKPCDIYSLGVTLASCVMDFDVYDDYVERDVLSDYMALLAQSPPDQCPPGIPPLLASLIYYMIQYDPKKRPTIEEVLNHEWLREGTSRKRKKKWTLPVKNMYGMYAWYTFN